MVTEPSFVVPPAMGKVELKSLKLVRPDAKISGVVAPVQAALVVKFKVNNGFSVAGIGVGVAGGKKKPKTSTSNSPLGSPRSSETPDNS